MIKAGIIGCGVIAPTHIEGYRTIPGVEVVHLADLVKAKADALGDRYGVARRSVGYRELLADPEVQLVSICTDHASHAEITVAALEAGKHVICEKPLGRVPADLDAMLAAARRHPELIATGIFQHRFQPTNRKLKELLEIGKFGRILAVNLVVNCLRTDEYYRADAWRGTMAGEGGGVLINQAIHHLDQLRYLFGNLKEVASLTDNQTHQGVIEVEDVAVFAFRSAAGVPGTVTASSSSAAHWRSVLTVIGTEAELEYADEKILHLEGPEERVAEIRAALEVTSNEKVVGKQYYGVGHTAQLADVVEAIQTGGKPEVSLAEAANSAALVMSVYEAAATGRWSGVAVY